MRNSTAVRVGIKATRFLQTCNYYGFFIRTVVINANFFNILGVSLALALAFIRPLYFDHGDTFSIRNNNFALSVLLFLFLFSVKINYSYFFFFFFFLAKTNDQLPFSKNQLRVSRVRESNRERRMKNRTGAFDRYFVRWRSVLRLKFKINFHREIFRSECHEVFYRTVTMLHGLDIRCTYWPVHNGTRQRSSNLPPVIYNSRIHRQLLN